MKRTVLALLGTAMLLGGCSKLTKENYDKIRTGMHYDEVVTLIGKPENCSEAIGLSVCEWKNGDSTVTVNFIANKVTLRTASNLK